MVAANCNGLRQDFYTTTITPERTFDLHALPPFIH
jgi:hypothetical protein